MHGRLLLKTAIDGEGQCWWVWQGQKKLVTTLVTEKTTVKSKTCHPAKPAFIIVLPPCNRDGHSRIGLQSSKTVLLISGLTTKPLWAHSFVDNFAFFKLHSSSHCCALKCAASPIFYCSWICFNCLFVVNCMNSQVFVHVEVWVPLAPLAQSILLKLMPSRITSTFAASFKKLLLYRVNKGTTMKLPLQ